MTRTSIAITSTLFLLCGLASWAALSFWHELASERTKVATLTTPPASAAPLAAAPVRSSEKPTEVTKKDRDFTDSINAIFDAIPVNKDLFAGTLAERMNRSVGLLKTVEPGAVGDLANVHAATSLAALRRFWTLAVADDKVGMKELKDSKQVIFTNGSIRVIRRVEQSYEVRFIDGPMKDEAMWVHEFAVRDMKQQ